MNDDEPKKNYYGVYGTVIFLYVTMIIVYSVVVHNATKNGAADNVPCINDDELNPCPVAPAEPTDAISLFLAAVLAQ